jgi:nucleoside-diphosphate-sugar epimerase
MTESFTASAPGALAKSSAMRRRVLVTGAAGNIGAYFAEHSHEKYDLRLMVHKLDDKAEALRGLRPGRPGEAEAALPRCRYRRASGRRP